MLGRSNVGSWGEVHHGSCASTGRAMEYWMLLEFCPNGSLVDLIYKKVERKLDHVVAYENDVEGFDPEAMHQSLPEEMKDAFDVFEIQQLHAQFNAIFDGDHDGRISSDELLSAAARIGDTMDPG